jgi:hypothetical protein
MDKTQEFLGRMGKTQRISGKRRRVAYGGSARAHEESQRGTAKQQQLVAPPGDGGDARWRGERSHALHLPAMAT